MADTPRVPYVGQAMKRVEDPRLLRGAATYMNDLRLPGMLHAAFVRSPYRARTRDAHRRRSGSFPHQASSACLWAPTSTSLAASSRAPRTCRI